jgi:DinB family protein
MTLSITKEFLRVPSCPWWFIAFGERMEKLPEPWLRGTFTDVPAVQRAVLHALEMAKEDVEHWCGGLTDEELNGRPAGIAPVAFHVRHIARSLDRLLTYAEGNSLSTEQLAVLKTELDPGATRDEVFAEFAEAMEKSAARVRAFMVTDLAKARGIGRKQLPTSVGGLLVHVADHTQRHVGQAITTARVVLASRKQT